jgi:hypothetical protein
MDVDTGTVRSTGQISTSTIKVKAVAFQARETNDAPVYIGVKGMTASNGWELTPGKVISRRFNRIDREGSVPFSKFYVVVTGGDAIDWDIITE